MHFMQEGVLSHFAIITLEWFSNAFPGRNDYMELALNISFFETTLNLRFHKSVDGLWHHINLPIMFGLKLREERRLRSFENKILRRIFGPKSDENGGN